MTKSFEIKLKPKDAKVFFKSSSEQAEKLRFTNRSLFEASTHEQAKITTLLISKIATNKINLTETSSGIGGNTVEFAKTFKNVNSIELDPLTHKCLKSNCKTLKVDKNINFINDNCLKVLQYTKQDVIFMDPPWGGVDYKGANVSLEYQNEEGVGIDIPSIIKKYAKTTKYIVVKTPINIDMNLYKPKKLNFKFLYETKFISSINKRPLYKLLFYTNNYTKSIPRTITCKPAMYKLIKYVTV